MIEVYPCISQLHGERLPVTGTLSLACIVHYRVNISAQDTTGFWMKQADIRKQYGDENWQRMIKQFNKLNKPIKIKKEEEILDI